MLTFAMNNVVLILVSSLIFNLLLFFLLVCLTMNNLALKQKYRKLALKGYYIKYSNSDNSNCDVINNADPFF